MASLKQTFYNIRKSLYNFSTHFGYKYNLGIYDKGFFAENQDEGVKMAGWFVPLLQQVFNFKSLVDIGCGTGHYLRYCVDHGIGDVFGLEGSPHAFENLLVDRSLVAMHDLRTPYHFQRTWDLAISIEVAEHIDKIHSDNYVKILTDASDIVVLTAAHPLQGGTAHVNEQPQEWWKEKFMRVAQFEYDGNASQKLRDGIEQAKSRGLFVTGWFAPNIMVFRKQRQ